MKSGIVLLSFLFTGLASSQQLSVAEYGHFVGYYTIDEVWPSDQFKNFQQLELHSQQLNDKTFQKIGRVVIFIDSTQPEADSMCTVPLQKLYITRDSLFFRSRECFGETYEFKGKILAIPSDTDEHQNDPIFQGMLTYFRHHTIIKRAAVKFVWSIGC
jgi:hypothetical protein